MKKNAFKIFPWPSAGGDWTLIALLEGFDVLSDSLRPCVQVTNKRNAVCCPQSHGYLKYPKLSKDLNVSPSCIQFFFAQTFFISIMLYPPFVYQPGLSTNPPLVGRDL